MTTTTRTSRIEEALTRLAGFPVEVTVRWENQFTLSAEGDCTESLKSLVAKIGGKLEAGADHGFDEECDMSCVYFNAQ